MPRAKRQATIVSKPAWLLDAPVGAPPEPPITTRTQLLPISELSWEDFERLCLRLSRNDGHPEHWQIYGTLGQAQGGIDVLVRNPSGRYTVWQSKRYKTFTAAKIKAAVKKFLEGPWAAKAERFVLASSASFTSTDISDAIESASADLKSKNIIFDTRDDAKLSSILKDLPEIVDDFFDRPWVEKFCGRDVAFALGNRLARRDFGELRSRLNELYKAHFASVDPGVLRAAGIGSSQQTPLALSARFVPPDVIATQDSSADAWETLRQPIVKEETESLSDDQEGRQGVETLTRRRYEPRRIVLNAWGQDLERSIVVGPPGAGKSTLLRFIALDAFADQPKLPILREKFPGSLPVWISFPFWTRQIKRQAAGPTVSVAGIVQAWFEAHDEPHLAQLVLRAIQDKRVLLLVDGVDEWVDETAAGTAIALLNTFVETRQLPVVVTSRPHGARILASLDNTWKRYELAPLTRKQQIDFASAWFEHLLPADVDSPDKEARARQRAEVLIAEIHRTPQIVPLAEVPLMLGGLLAIAWSGASLPRSRFRAYQELCNRILEFQPRARGQAALLPDQSEDLDPSTRERILASLAYEVQANPTSEVGLDAINVRAAREICKKFLIVDLDLPGHEATQRSHRLMSSSEEALGILVRKSPEEIGFLHKALQEFLASRHISSLSLEEQCELVRLHAADPRWRDILLFVVQSTSRPGDVERLIAEIEIVKEVDDDGWSANLLLADVVFGDVRRSASTTKRLATEFFEFVESGSDWTARGEVLNRIIAGLSNEQTAIHIRPKLRSWFPSMHGHNIADALRFMASWGDDTRVDNVLWRNLQNDLEPCRLAAAEALAKRQGGSSVWLSRLSNLVRDPPSPTVAAAAMQALAAGWNQEPTVRILADFCASSRSEELAISGISARVGLGIRQEVDRLRLIDIIHADFALHQAQASKTLLAGWKGSSAIKNTLLTGIDSRPTLHEINLELLADAFPGDDDAARNIADLLTKPEQSYRLFQMWNVLSRNFKQHPEMLKLIDVVLQQKRLDPYVLAMASNLFPTDALKYKHLEVLSGDINISFWSVGALLDHWGMDDKEVSVALRETLSWSPHRISDFADRIPDIVESPGLAETILRRCLDEARENPTIRTDRIVIGMQKIGLFERDAELVDAVLGLGLLEDNFRSGLTAAALIQACPRDTKVLSHAHEQLHHNAGLSSVIALMMGHDQGIRDDLLSVSVPLPLALRQAMAKSLHNRAIEEAFSRELLYEGGEDTDDSISSASPVGIARCRMVRAEIDPAYITDLRLEMKAAGPRYGARRLGALAALAVVERGDIIAELGASDELNLGYIYNLGSNDVACSAIAEKWGYLAEFIGRDGILKALHLDVRDLSSTFGRYADDIPELQSFLDKVLVEQLGESGWSGEMLRILSRQKPRSDVLLTQCMSVLNNIGRNWYEAEPQLVAAEIIGAQFAGNADLLKELCKINDQTFRSGATAAIVEGWPQSQETQDIFDKLIDHSLDMSKLNAAAAMKIVFAKSKPHKVVQNLEEAAEEMTGDIWDAIPYWLPNAIRRIRNDHEVAESMLDLIQKSYSPSVVMSFLSLLVQARGMDEIIQSYCSSKLKAVRNEFAGVFGFDLWSGTNVLFSRRLLEILRSKLSVS